MTIQHNPRIRPIPSAQRDAVLQQARRRRRGRGAAPLDLLQSHQFAVGATVPGAAFPDYAKPITFRSKILITGTAAGNVFTMGNATTALSLYLTAGTSLVLRAGDAAAADKILSVTLLPGVEFEVTCAIRPGDGKAKVWAYGNDLRGTEEASGGELPNGFSASVDGIYGGAAPGSYPADVVDVGAPTGFSVIEPLRVFYDQLPADF